MPSPNEIKIIMTKTGPVCFPSCFCLGCRQVAGVMDCLIHVTLSLSSSLPFLPSFADSSTGVIAFAAAPHLDPCLPTSSRVPRCPLSLSLPRYPLTKMWMSLSKAWTSVQRWKLPTTYRIAAISVIGKSPDPPVPQTRSQPFSLHGFVSRILDSQYGTFGQPDAHSGARGRSGC